MTFEQRLLASLIWMSIPFAFWLVLYYLSTYRKVPLKPMAPWLVGLMVVLFGLSFGFDLGDRQRVGNLCRMLAWSFYTINAWIQYRSKFATVRSPSSRWFRARVELPRDIRVQVSDMAGMSDWYTEKLGLRRLNEPAPFSEQGSATLKFNEDGKSIILTPNASREIQPTPMFLTKKIGKLKDILAARGIHSGAIEADRQGIRYFEIHDPEGNTIEVVQG